MTPDDIRGIAKVRRLDSGHFSPGSSVPFQVEVAASGKRYRCIQRCSFQSCKPHGLIPAEDFDYALSTLVGLLDIDGVNISDVEGITE